MTHFENTVEKVVTYEFIPPAKFQKKSNLFWCSWYLCIPVSDISIQSCCLFQGQATVWGYGSDQSSQLLWAVLPTSSITELHNHWKQFGTRQCTSVQYNTMQYNTIQKITIQCTTQYNTIQHNTIWYNEIQYVTHNNSVHTIMMHCWRVILCLSVGSPRNQMQEFMQIQCNTYQIYASVSCSKTSHFKGIILSSTIWKYIWSRALL